MATPRVLVLRAPGTNCDQETAHAFEQAGAASDIRHVFDVRESPAALDAYQILCIPGGFSYGDDVAAGRLFALQFEQFLADSLRRFIDGGKLILGICNGFQTLLKSGLLDDPAAATREATLTWNDHGRYEDRWVDLQVDGTRCVFLRGVERLYLPIAHAEGKFVGRDEETLESLGAAGRLALRYAAASSGESREVDSADAPLPFPVNPNGSQWNVAGCCDPTGRVFGLMPHPERHIDPLQHPRWTRGEQDASLQGSIIFANAVRHFA